MLAIKQHRLRPTKESLRTVLSLATPSINSAVESIVGSYNSPVISRRAVLMAANFIGNYDETKGTKFNTFLYNNLMPLKRLAPKMTEALPVTEQIILDKKLIDEARRDFFDMKGIEPTEEELADLTNLSKKRIAKVQAAPIPVYEGAFKDQENPDITSSPGVNSAAEGRDIDLLYNDLSDDDKQVYSYRTGYGGNPILDSSLIAEKMNRDTKWVSQRASKIQDRINNVLGRA